MTMAVVVRPRPLAQLKTKAARESSARVVFIASSSRSKSCRGAKPGFREGAAPHPGEGTRGHGRYLLLGGTEVGDGDAPVGEARAGALVLVEDLLGGQAALEHLHLLLRLQVDLQPLLRLQQVALQRGLELLQRMEEPSPSPNPLLVHLFLLFYFFNPLSTTLQPTQTHMLCPLLLPRDRGHPNPPRPHRAPPCCHGAAGS